MEGFFIGLNLIIVSVFSLSIAFILGIFNLIYSFRIFTFDSTFPYLKGYYYLKIQGVRWREIIRNVLSGFLTTGIFAIFLSFIFTFTGFPTGYPSLLGPFSMQLLMVYLIISSFGALIPSVVFLFFAYRSKSFTIKIDNEEKQVIYFPIGKALMIFLVFFLFIFMGLNYLLNFYTLSSHF